MQELSRVNKNKGIIMILAPYYTQTLKMVNFFHETPLTEDLFRFFTSFDSKTLKTEEYECPHAVWHLFY